MINNCRFLNLILQICSLSNAVCPYMPDPLSCPSYDEGFGQKRTDMEVESFNGFAERMEAELNGLGIKVEKIEEAPDWF